ncbi:RcnB family protein [Phenylobacterium deserti]|uniref:RcnB family protein n=1 Tax=Phenylobacterium deserti TaxID=1914756 RepID=A0A328A904_9CAUL|nr:RcnB family protein [Phenylobacterium deserti]RAK50985.1 hypothetical protein DJ018_17675 [Phenylobacterium deserti]
MKRLILTLAALTALAGPLAAAGDAAAQGRNGRGHQERGWDRGRGGGERDWSPGRGNGRGQGPRGWERRDREGPRYAPSRGYAPPREYAPYDAPRYRAPGPRYGVRRGGYLPPDYRGAMLGDYRRFRLRPPPPGYDWYRVGDDYLLVSRSNGLIFDVIRP